MWRYVPVLKPGPSWTAWDPNHAHADPFSFSSGGARAAVPQLCPLLVSPFNSTTPCAPLCGHAVRAPPPYSSLSARLHPSPPVSARLHPRTHPRAAASPQVNFIDTPDLSSRSLGDPANHSAPPPSPSTPSSVSGGPHSTWDSHPPSAPSEPLEGATGSRARKDHGAFGDEATSTINQLNTPSPVLDRDHKVRT